MKLIFFYHTGYSPFFQLTQIIMKYVTEHHPDPAPARHYELCGEAEMEGSDQSAVPPSRHKLLSSTTVHVASPPAPTPHPTPLTKPFISTASVISNQQMGRGFFFSSFTAGFNFLAIESGRFLRAKSYFNKSVIHAACTCRCFLFSDLPKFFSCPQSSR